MEISEQKQFTRMSDDEDDLELLRKAALQTLNNSMCKTTHVSKQMLPAVNPIMRNKFSMSPKRGRGFYNSGTMRGCHRNGQLNRNTNLISIPTLEQWNKIATVPPHKLALPQDRYCTKAETVDTKKEVSKFSRYVDHSEDSDSDNSDFEVSESSGKLKKSNSLDALMQELEFEISGEKHPANVKSKVKKAEHENSDVAALIENDAKSTGKKLEEKTSDNDKIERHSSILEVDLPTENDSKPLLDDTKSKPIGNNKSQGEHDLIVTKFNVERKTGPPFPKKGLLPKPTNYANHHAEIRSHSLSFKNPVAANAQNPGFHSHYSLGNQYTNELPYLPPNRSYPSNNHLLPSGIYHQQTVNIPRPLSPLNLNTDALCTIAMAPLSPRSAAFVLQNREIIEKRKRSPRQSYSRSPSPTARQRSNSRSPRRIQSPSRRRYPYSASPNRSPRRNPRSPPPRSRRSPTPPANDRSLKKDFNDRSPKKDFNDRSPRKDFNDRSTKKDDRNLKKDLNDRRSPCQDDVKRRRTISPEASRKRNSTPEKSLKKHSPIISVKRTTSPNLPGKQSATPRRSRSTSPVIKVRAASEEKTSNFEMKESNDSAKEEADSVLDARRKKFEQSAVSNEGVIRLKPMNPSNECETSSDTPEKDKGSSNEEDDMLVLDAMDTNLHAIFTDEESDDENEGRFKSITTDKSSGSVLRFSQVVNGPNRDIKNKSLDDTCRERNRDRRDVRHHRDRERFSRGNRDIERGYRNPQVDRKVRIDRKDERKELRRDEDASRWKDERRDERNVERRDNRIERRDDRKDDTTERKDNRKDNRSERKDDRKPSVKTRLTLKKEEEKNDADVPSSTTGKRNEEVKRKHAKVSDDVEWVSNEPSKIKIKDKPVMARKVAIANIGKDENEYKPQEVVLTVINNDEQDVIKKNEGDLRAQLSRKRAERQCHKPSVTTEDVQSRLLHYALGAVFQKSKKSKRAELEAAPKEKLSIHQRLGLSEEHSSKKKKSKRNTEQV